MIPLEAAGLAGLAALGAFFARRTPAYASAVGALGLFAAAGVALIVPWGQTLVVGQVVVTDAPFVRAVIAAAAGSTALLCLIAAVLAPEVELPIAAGVVVGGLAVALSLSDASTAIVLGGAVGFLGLVGARGAWSGAFRQLAFVPAVALLVVLVAGAKVIAGEAAVSDAAIVLGALLGVAFVARLASVPVHAAPLRLARGASLPLVPLHAALLPIAFVLPALAWLAGSPVAAAFPGSWLQPVLVSIGGATIVLAALAMFVQNDFGALIAVHTIGDLGLVLVGLGTGGAALPQIAVWLIGVALIRMAMAGWAMIVAERSGSRTIRGSRGWVHLAPLSLPAFAVAVVVGVGWPGSLLFEARRQILEGAVPGTMGVILTAASITTALGYVRVLWTGLRHAPEGQRAVRFPWSWRLERWTASLLAIGIGLIPAAIAAGLTGLDSVAATWRPFAGP